MSKNKERLDTIIGKAVRIKGDIITDTGLRLDGQIEGNVEVGSILITGKDSLIKGDIRCKDAIVAGRIEGNIYISNGLEMQSGATIFGDIQCKRLIIQKDCFFEGKCQMVERKEDLVTVWVKPGKIEKSKTSNLRFHYYCHFKLALGDATKSISAQRLSSG